MSSNVVAISDEESPIPVSVVVSPHSRRRRVGKKDVVTPLLPASSPSSSTTTPTTATTTTTTTPTPTIPSETKVFAPNIDTLMTADGLQTSRQPTAPPSSPSDPVRSPSIPESMISPSSAPVSPVMMPAPTTSTTSSVVAMPKIEITPPPAVSPVSPSSSPSIQPPQAVENEVKVAEVSKPVEIKQQSEEVKKSKGIFSNISRVISEALTSSSSAHLASIATVPPKEEKKGEAELTLSMLPVNTESKKEEKKKPEEKNIKTIYVQPTQYSSNSNTILHAAFTPYNVRLSGPYMGADCLTRWWVGTGQITPTLQAQLSALACVKKIQIENPFITHGSKPTLTSLNKIQLGSRGVASVGGRNINATSTTTSTSSSSASSLPPAPSGTQRVLVKKQQRK